MKNILVLFVVTALIFGCETSDNDTPVVSIIGVWNGVSINFSGIGVTELQGGPISANVVGEGYHINYTITFNENPAIVTSAGSISVEATAIVQGQTYTENEEGIDVSFSSPWSQNGDTLVLTFEEEEVIANIIELTETSLVLQFIVERTETINGITIIAALDITASFSRQ